MHMCMVGLRSIRSRLPLKKPSELWASDEHLLWRFRTRKCDGKHEHDTIEGGGRVRHLKFGRGVLPNCLQMALKTSFEFVLKLCTPCIRLAATFRRVQWVDRSYPDQFRLRKLTQFIRLRNTDVVRVATALRRPIPDTHEYLMSANGR